MYRIYIILCPYNVKHVWAQIVSLLKDVDSAHLREQVRAPGCSSCEHGITQHVALANGQLRGVPHLFHLCCYSSQVGPHCLQQECRCKQGPANAFPEGAFLPSQDTVHWQEVQKCRCTWEKLPNFAIATTCTVSVSMIISTMHQQLVHS